MKTKLKDQIRELLKDHNNVDQVFYYDNDYHIVSEGQIIKISHPEAIEFLKQCIYFFSLLEDKRKFDIDSGQWIGGIPVHVMPSGLPKRKVTNITTAFPVTDFLQFYKKRSANRKDYIEPITGMRIIKDE